jgi:hypothetical protein
VGAPWLGLYPDRVRAGVGRRFETRAAGYTAGEVESGPIRESVIADLEALKWRLAAMDSPDELPADQAAALGVQVSAIRLHLKRLDLERLRILRQG